MKYRLPAVCVGPVSAMVFVMSAVSAQAVSYSLTSQGPNVLTGNQPGENSSFFQSVMNSYDPDFDNGDGTFGAQTVQGFATAQIYIQGRETGSIGPDDDFRAFCIQFDQGLAIPSNGSPPNSTYDRNTTHFDSLRRDKIATLLANAYTDGASTVEYAALQLAVWKVAHSDLTPVTGAAYDLNLDSDQNLFEGGYFNVGLDPDDVPIVNGVEDDHPSVWALTLSYLDGLDEDGSNDWDLVRFEDTTLTFLTSATSQDLVVIPEGSDIVPAPLPAGLPLAAAGLGALAVIRRRRRS